MTKLNKKTYRGIEYINLSSLSEDHSYSLRKILSNRTLINILQDDLVVTNCVLYSAYVDWYESLALEVETKSISKQPEVLLSKRAVLSPA